MIIFENSGNTYKKYVRHVHSRVRLSLNSCFIIILPIERTYRNFEEIRTALEDGEIDGALLDTYVAAEHKEEIFSEEIYVKEILDRPFGYGVVLSGAARNVEQRCRDYIDLQIREIFEIIQNTTKTLDVSFFKKSLIFKYNVIIRAPNRVGVEVALAVVREPENVLLKPWIPIVLLLKKTIFILLQSVKP